MSDVHSELANVRHTCGHCCHDTSFPKLLSDVRVQVSDCIVLTERAMQGERIDAIHTKNTTKEKREKKRCLLTDLDPYIQPILYFSTIHMEGPSRPFTPSRTGFCWASLPKHTTRRLEDLTGPSLWNYAQTETLYLYSTF